MPFTSTFIQAISAQRLRQIDHFRRHAAQVQWQQFSYLTTDKNQYIRGAKTGDYNDFKKRIPVVDYDTLNSQIEQILHGNEGILWSSSPTRWFAKSSGTAGGVSKFIPITEDSLNKCHFQGGRDTIAIFADNHKDTSAFSGKSLTLGGSHRLSNEHSGALVGDLSAILIQNTPWYASLIRTPSAEVALIPDFEQKVEQICRHTITQRVTSFAGVPSWNLVLMNKVLEFTGKSHIHEVWPEMSLFIHGGIAFTPYREQYARLFPDPRMRYMETYNASEGFFALQDDPGDSSMLLMLDYEIFYEFLSLSSLDDPDKAIPLEDVRTGVNYAMIITTSGGLWRYMIGDTVEFTSLSPYKIKITGRTKHFINAFGEELIIDNAERALDAACRATGALIQEYTAGPIYMEGSGKGGHEWLIEFATEPSSVELFTKTLDEELQTLNSDYAAKRYRSTTLYEPLVRVVPTGTFYQWMASRGKIGGQNKVPRLANDRRYLDALLAR